MSLFRRITIQNKLLIITGMYLEHTHWSILTVVIIWKILLNPFKVRGRQTLPWPSSLPLPAHWHQRWPQHRPGSGHLAVLGQVESCDLLGLLDLLLVGLHLALQLVNEGLHPLVVLAILVAGKAQLL